MMEGDDEDSATFLPSSSFTPINRRAVQLPTPQCTASKSRKQHRQNDPSSVKRARNPVIANYLGLGSSDRDEAGDVEERTSSPAPIRPTCTKPNQKRRRVEGASHVRNPSTKGKAAGGKAALSPTNTSAILPGHDLRQPATRDDAVVMVRPDCVRRNAPNVVHSDTKPCSTSSDFVFAIEDDDYDDIADDELVELTHRTEYAGSSCIPTNPLSRLNSTRELVQSDREHTQYPSVASEPIGKPLSKTTKAFVSPVTQTTRLLANSGDAFPTPSVRPIVRPPFPPSACNLPVIAGMTSATTLRTCFRIGEAVKASHRALKEGKHIIIELYARVLDSERDEVRQTFTFCDLFHSRPPFINAAYAAAIWKPVPLHEYDGGRLLQTGKMCRCIGIMRREGKEWCMVVLNVWGVTWEDIWWVEGIVCA